MKKGLLFAATVVFMGIAYLLASSYYKENQIRSKSFLAQENSERFVRDYSQTLGSDDAKVYLIEFLDPACESCAAFSPHIKRLVKESDGRVKLVIRYAPLHQGSEMVVKILEAASKQGKYWETLELLFKTQPKWASHHNPQPELIWQFLPMVGLDIARIRKDMNDPVVQQIIKQDLEDVKALKIRMTPEFFVNGKPLPKFGWNELLELVESELADTYN
jgi:protein-disulfide isomerase